MIKRKKILFTLPNLLGGGAERVMVNIINQLDNKYFDITLLLINRRGALNTSIVNKVNIIDLNISRTRYSLFLIIKTIRKINPCIIFSTTHRMNILILLASFFIKRKIKIFIREPNMPSLLIKNSKLTKVQLSMIKFLYKFSYKIVAQTDEMKEDIINSYSMSKSKVITFYNPIDCNFIKESIKNSKNPFDRTKINIVSSGRIIDQKAYDILIRSFEIVVKNDPNYRLYILGEDVVGLKKELLKLVKKSKLENFVLFKGFIDNPYIYYNYSDLFVLSSRWEGLPNVIIENLYLEKPIIATNCIKYLSRLINNGKNGFIVPVDDYKKLADKILNYKIIKPRNTYIQSDINSLFNKDS